MDKREAMVKEIKYKYDLNSPKVLSAMLQIPREEFVPKDVQDWAYNDCALDIGFGQTISQPYTVAFMADLLDLYGDEKVLEIGTGSGYQAAILSLLCKEVYSLERIKPLVQRAKKTIQKLKIKNVHIRHGSGEFGWPEASPFDAILITARINGKVPQALIDQLKEGGIIVAPISETMYRFVKRKNKLESSKHGFFRFVPFVRI